MIAPKCAVDPSYNVSFDVHCPPSSLPTLARGKQFALVNNKAQGLFSVAFLKEALLTLRKYCEYFGVQYSHEKGYAVKVRGLYKQWQQCTGAMADEIWLLNSYLIHLHMEWRSHRPITELRAKHMCEHLPVNDNVIVAEMHEYRANVIRLSLIHI